MEEEAVEAEGGGAGPAEAAVAGGCRSFGLASTPSSGIRC